MRVEYCHSERYTRDLLNFDIFLRDGIILKMKIHIAKNLPVSRTGFTRSFADLCYRGMKDPFLRNVVA